MRKLFYFACLLLGCCQTTQVAHAGVTDRVVYSYYIARAQPGTPLGATLDSFSPIRDKEGVFHANTKWVVGWKFQSDAKADGHCRIKRVDVDLDSRITLPALSNASEQQDSQFQPYLAALRVHELGHVDFGKQAALTINQGIISLPEMASCAELDLAANRLANQVLNDARAKEIQYDVSTHHGRTQGVTLN